MYIDPTLRDKIRQQHKAEIQRVLFCTDLDQIDLDMAPSERLEKRIEYLTSLRKGDPIAVPNDLRSTHELLAQIHFIPQHYYQKIETVEALVALTHRLGIRHDTLSIYWWWHMYGDEPMPSSLLPLKLRCTPFWS
jgi:hypothetical protein